MRNLIAGTGRGMALIGTDAHTGLVPCRAFLLGAGGRAARALAKTAALVGATGLALAIATMLVTANGPPGGVQAAPSASPEWIDIRRPLPVFDLVGTEFAKLPSRYDARRHAEGGGRRDALTFGAIGFDGPFLHLVFYRVGREAEPLTPLVIELARVASDDGLAVLRNRPPGKVSTRFGPVELADLALLHDGAPAPCLGFRAAPDGGTALRIAGFLCGSRTPSAARAALACVIDKIDLLAAADDPGLQRIFVDAERRRGPPCAAFAQAPGRDRAAWLDPRAALPPLKRLVEADAVGSGIAATGPTVKEP